MDICRTVLSFIQELSVENITAIVFSYGNLGNLNQHNTSFAMKSPRIVFLLSGIKNYEITANSGTKKFLITPKNYLYVCPFGLLKPLKLTRYHMISIVYMEDYVRVVSLMNAKLKGIPPNVPDVFYHSTSPISSTGKMLLSILNHPQVISEDSLKYVFIALLKETTSCLSNNNQTISKSQETFNLILHYISENLFNTKLSREDAAKKLSLNPEYISQLFVRYTKITFTAFINSERIDMAASLLETTNKSIKAISGLCGFSSSEYFIRVFRKIKNQSPSKYRRFIMGTK